MLALSKNEDSGIQLMAVSLPVRSIDKSIYDRFKTIIDVLFAAVLLTLTSPVILLCLIAVRLGSKGSPIYSQRRLGSGGRLFCIHKIRTMYVDCERNSGPVWSGQGDPRVTRLGRLLRATHLDELPQLVNVVRGEMSLIGPRPERPEIAEQLDRCFSNYRDRLLVRPGLSGLAQVLQGPDTNLDAVRTKLRYDLYYRDHHGIWLDLRIALATVFGLLCVPGPVIARIFRFPLYNQLPVEPLPQGEPIAVSSHVRPTYAS